MFIEKYKPVRSGKSEKTVWGVGINDAGYVIAYTDSDGIPQKCPYYRTWYSMLERCFSVPFQKKHPSYVGTTVDSQWLRFSNFRKWMLTQDWEGNALDKDLLGQNRKHYGVDTCVFVSTALNNLLTLRNNARGNYPLGVSKIKVRQYTYYVASCSFYGTQKRLGYFNTIDEAANAYKTAKLAHIKELANEQKDPRIKQVLLSIY